MRYRRSWAAPAVRRSLTNDWLTFAELRDRMNQRGEPAASESAVRRSLTDLVRAGEVDTRWTYPLHGARRRVYRRAVQR